MLEARSLRKTYGNIVAVNDVSLRADAGETIGLLGPNGAGKTTTVSIVAGLVRPDAGEVLIQGRPLGGDTDPLKLKLGLVPQDLALYDELPALQNLMLFAALYNLSGAEARKAIGEAMDLVGLADRVNDKVATYSGGMKRRLNLAAALLHDPQILLLDEPTVGVDPQSRNAIFENLETLKQRGKTLVYTTHYMEEAERLCDRIIIIDHGKVIANDTLQGLYRLIPASNVLVIELDERTNGVSLDEMRALSEVRTVEQQGTTLRIGVNDLAAHAPRVLQWLVDHSLEYRHVVSERADLETVFLTLTGRSLRDA
jgi:linearmycin/streptolysin S transport system ATP-binding protein